MEKTCVVRFEQNEETSFYLCRQCKTHLALHEELVHKYVTNQHGLYKNLVNVKVAEIEISGQSAAPASCITCDSIVGYKFVALKMETSAITNGRFMIDMKQLLLWKGKQMVYADTEQLVENA